MSEPARWTIEASDANRVIVSCFFFQAEDGIRDDLVTGVQTCALPIWIPSACWIICDVERFSVAAWPAPRKSSKLLSASYGCQRRSVARTRSAVSNQLWISRNLQPALAW